MEGGRELAGRLDGRRGSWRWARPEWIDGWLLALYRSEGVGKWKASLTLLGVEEALLVGVREEGVEAVRFEGVLEEAGKGLLSERSDRPSSSGISGTVAASSSSSTALSSRSTTGMLLCFLAERGTLEFPLLLVVLVVAMGRLDTSEIKPRRGKLTTPEELSRYSAQPWMER